MPETYRVTLSDGRTFNVTTEGGPPSEADVLGSLSNDAPAVGAHPEAIMRAPTTADPVTVGELLDNPREALGRIGAILKKDVTDPKLWLSAAAAYFGPKVLTSRPVVTALQTASRVRMSPGVALKAGPTGVSVKPTFGFHLKPVTAPATPPAPTAAPAASAAAKVAPSTALQQAKDAFVAAKAIPQPGELSWVTAYMKLGLTPDAAVAKALTYRPKPTMSAAEALAQQFGTPSDAEVASAVAAKNARTTPARGGTKR
jgi:hypothetical protein